MRRFHRGSKADSVQVVEPPPRPLRGIRFDLGEQAGRLRQLSPLVKRFRVPEGFHLWNGEYESVDAEVLWAMAAGLRPHRVMVVGAGAMTRRVLDAALPETTLRTEDPIALAARDIVVAGTPDADLVLGLLPELAPGVVVHLHPLRLPWPAGPEQDLLHAFLSGNRHYEVLLANYALTREHPEIVRQAVPSWRGASEPGSLWLRRS